MHKNYFYLHYNCIRNIHIHGINKIMTSSINPTPNIINLSAGDSRNLTFQENVTTGYQWVTQPINNQYVQITKGPNIQSSSCLPNVVGCGGNTTFKVSFSPTTPHGSSIEIDFYYLRTFDKEENMAPTSIYIFKIM